MDFPAPVRKFPADSRRLNPYENIGFSVQAQLNSAGKLHVVKVFQKFPQIPPANYLHYRQLNQTLFINFRGSLHGYRYR